jgi:hypothetical protein
LALFGFLSALIAVGAAQSPAEQVAPKAPGYVVPRTSWGDPDLTGIWPSIDMVRVPVQRAPQYGTRLFMTAEEHAAQEKREQEMIVRMANEGAGGATGAPGHWVEWGKSQRQTSLIIDPPDGRMPALTFEGQARAAAAPRGTMGTAPLNGPEDFTMWERCISRGALGSTLPVLYNSGIDITQAPGVVSLRYEMVHDFRIIPLDGRPHLSKIDAQFSAVFQSKPGQLLGANYAVPAATVAQTLGRLPSGNVPNVTVNLIEPGTLYGDRINQLDFRISKSFRFGRIRPRVAVDLLNVLNANPVLTYNQTFVPNGTWLQANSILTGRFARISGEFTF